MANIFLDTNIVVDLFEKRKGRSVSALDVHTVYISVLCVHILAYVLKEKIPSNRVNDALDLFSFIDVTKSIVLDACIGPTQDLEDNIQLHSAAYADADYFLTEDKKILAMKFFGRTKIVSQI